MRRYTDGFCSRNDSETLRSVVVYTTEGGRERVDAAESNTATAPHHTISYRTAPHRTGGQGGGNVARPYCAERRRPGVATTLVGVSQAGRCLVPAPSRYGTRHNRTVHVRRDGASARSSVPPSLAFVRIAPPSSDPESHAPTLRDQAREFGRAGRGGVSL